MARILSILVLYPLPWWSIRHSGDSIHHLGGSIRHFGGSIRHFGSSISIRHFGRKRINLG
ncbi:hypothetical protein ACFVT8_13510 [Lysinibacillus sp. NPDC058147]|uniref:hypothetical protein n=1 Tax=unclassified Lysinibacillus TaxID=2636778 RepID=UPI0036DAC770